MGGTNPCSGGSCISVVGCRFFGEVWRQDLGPDQLDHDPTSLPPEQRAGTVEWNDVGLFPVVARPRTWRPLCKRHPSFWVACDICMYVSMYVYMYM